MRICTWNTQGNPNKDKLKRKILEKLYEKCDVLLIQECGGLNQENVDLKGAVVFSEEQAGSANNRCSTCIITKRTVDDSGAESLQSATGRFRLMVQLDNINIYTLHAESGTGSDVISALRTCEPPFIMGGDMNCCPFQLVSMHVASNRHLIYTGTGSRLGMQAKFAKSSTITHPRTKNELDYFLYNGVSCSNTIKYHKKGGDHFPVITEVYLQTDEDEW